MRLKTNNFVMYLYDLLTKGLKEINFTQNLIMIQTLIIIKLNFHHHLELLCYKLKHKRTNKSMSSINLVFCTRREF